MRAAINQCNAFTGRLIRLRFVIWRCVLKKIIRSRFSRRFGGLCATRRSTASLSRYTICSLEIRRKLEQTASLLHARCALLHAPLPICSASIATVDCSKRNIPTLLKVAFFLLVVRHSSTPAVTEADDGNRSRTHASFSSFFLTVPLARANARRADCAFVCYFPWNSSFSCCARFILKQFKCTSRPFAVGL